MRRAARKAVRGLPAPRDEAAVRVAHAARDLLTGRAAPQPPKPAKAKRNVSAPRLRRKPSPIDTSDWVAPPISSGHDVLTRVLYDTGATPPTFDIELFEQLNAEYADKPIIAKPTSLVASDRIEAASRRIAWADRRMDLANKTTLEIGCSNGYETWLLAHNMGCDAYGVDVNARGAWDDLQGDKVHFECTDLTVDNPFENDKFDAILSYAVWEHVTHPRALLQETFNVLKPGGRAWIRANLYCGPQASHRYRDINFPWPHLLFSEDVIREWDVKHGRAPRGPSWVNRLTWDNYKAYVDEIGFELKHLDFQTPTWDEEFYQRFENMLGRWPKRDLNRDFVLMIIEKPL